ncbi:hypothetical protein GCM10025860_18030 [Methanobacterium ferruginis]|nr:hypothetical protein GCM10025860_18030 [Methanobacterium ferruginis]
MEQIYHSNTTEDMIELLEREEMVEPVFNSIAQAIQKCCQERFDINVDVVIVKMDGTVLNTNHQIEIIEQNP